VGLVIFNDAAIVLQPLRPLKDIDQVALEKQIMNLRAGGGTDISCAVKKVTEMYTKQETER
jgi:Mg-chelatase subunit ChlD